MNELKVEYKPIEEKIYSNIVFCYGIPEMRNFFEILNLKTLSQDGVESMTGSNSIIEYFNEISSQKSDFFGSSIFERSKLRSLVSWMDQDFFHNITKVILYEKIFKNYDPCAPSRSPDSTVIRGVEFKLKIYLQKIQDVLEKFEYYGCDSISYADLILASHISVLDYFQHITWGMNLRRLKHWYSMIKSRPSMKSILGLKILGFTPNKTYTMADF
jgi:glutathione S-transferase